MAVLTDQQRFEFWAELMRYWSRIWEPCNVLKADLRAGVDALDGHLEQRWTGIVARLNSTVPELQGLGLRRLFDRPRPVALAAEGRGLALAANNDLPVAARAGLRVEQKEDMLAVLIGYRLMLVA